MNYLIAIEPGDERFAFGVVVPDLPGCFSAGDTLQDALISAREAIALHLDVMGSEPPPARPVTHWMSHPEYSGRVWAIVIVDPSAAGLID